jgi:hypothetical protein
LHLKPLKTLVQSRRCQAERFENRLLGPTNQSFRAIFDSLLPPLLLETLGEASRGLQGVRLAH